jgi:DNA-binding CsgD family transcriptional regulator
MQPTAENLSKLLLTLYAAPMRSELWSVFLKEFTALLGLPAAAILHQDLAREKYAFGISSGMDPAAESLYAQYYGQIDPWRPRFLDKREGELSFGEDLCHASELHRTEFYTDCLSKYDVNLYCAVATIKRPDSFELISIYRGLHDDSPDSKILATIQLVIPHIRTALQLRHQLCEVAVSAKNYADTLHSLNLGVILLDAQARCLFVSRKAETICNANDGVYVRHSRLGAHAPADHHALHKLINRAVAVATGNTIRPCGAASIARSSGGPLVISAIALSPQAPLAHYTAAVAVAAVFIRDPKDEIASLPGILSATYGLTAAETRLTSRLFVGRSLAQAAEDGAVSLETVRVQLKSIFNKTGVRRQTDLLRLLAELVKGTQT